MAPLLKPEDCCIVFIDPVRRNVERIEREDAGHDSLISRHALIQEAAKVLDVPKFFAIDGDAVDEREWIAQPCDRSKPRVYARWDRRIPMVQQWARGSLDRRGQGLPRTLRLLARKKCDLCRPQRPCRRLRRLRAYGCLPKLRSPRARSCGRSPAAGGSRPAYDHANGERMGRSRL